MVAKDWKELVDKINATFRNEMSHIWRPMSKQNHQNEREVS
jgi:hypothetical protein